MTTRSDRWQELDTLLDNVLDGIYDDNDLQRLNEILRNDTEACRHYVLYVELHGRLAWGDGLNAKDADDFDVMPDALAAGRLAENDSPSSQPYVPIIIQTSPSIPSSFSPVGSFLFSYAVAAIAIVAGLLIGWTYQVSVSDQQIAQEKSGRPAMATLDRPSQGEYVGRITGMFNPEWSEPSTAAVPYAYVPLGRRYALSSGLVEISYTSGARVILQGPCVYEVASQTSGYLSIGRVTARLDKKPESKGLAASARSDSTVQAAGPELFSIRTPTAIVVDLGTEFGVEVDESGASRTHVFRGKVEMRTAEKTSRSIALGANESARVSANKGRDAKIVRETSPKDSFVRDMPKSVPIAVFSTGVGLKAGDPDPHWQIVARSDDRDFKPRPAEVIESPNSAFLANAPAHSQWLSLATDDVNLPQDVVFVFRTTFDLTGMLPSTAILRGKLIGDDRVSAIRLNGRRLSAPIQHDGIPFVDWASFQITSGFVKGRNVLEFDVLNADPFMPPEQRRTIESRMSLRVEFEGAATPEQELPGDKSAAKRQPAASVKDKTVAADHGKQEKTSAVAR